MKYATSTTAISFGKSLGRGGEGEAFLVEGRNDLAVKLYHPERRKAQEEKIQAMVTAGLSNSSQSIGYPQEVVRDASGAFVGFTMRAFGSVEPLHEVYAPAARIKSYPKAGYRFLARVATNLARAVSTLHQTGCRIGDINQSGILIGPDATVSLIDADSFQVELNGRLYRCSVGMAEYTPPELQGINLGTVTRTLDHDRFGLAVALFQILFLGRHPFSGRYSGAGDMPLEKAISEFRFAYSKNPRDMAPPPNTLLPSDLTEDVAKAFEQAFTNRAGARPSAEEWVSALSELERRLVPCAANELHARAHAACPLCRIETGARRSFFPLITGGAGSARPIPNDFSALLAHLRAVRAPGSVMFSLPQPKDPHPVVDPVLLEQISVKPVAKVLKALRIGIFVTAGLLFFVHPLFASLAILGFLLKPDPTIAARNLHVQSERNCADRLVAELHAAAEKSVQEDADKLAAGKDAASDFELLKSLAERSNIEAKYKAALRQRKLENFLGTARIRGAQIPKISGMDVSALQSHGVETALDLKGFDAQIVHGIGPVKAGNLSSWQRSVEAKFVFTGVFDAGDRAQVNQIFAEAARHLDTISREIRPMIDDAVRASKRLQSKETLRGTEIEKDVQTLTNLRALSMTAKLTPVDFPAPYEVGIKPWRGRSSASSGSAARAALMRLLEPNNVSSTSGSQPGRTFSSHSPFGTAVPQCPSCRTKMTLRTAKKGSNRGSKFWGCSNYPACYATRRYV